MRIFDRTVRILIGEPVREGPPERENPIQRALALKRLMAKLDLKTKADLARAVGLSRPRVTQLLNLLKLDDKTFSRLSGGTDPAELKHWTERRLRTLLRGLASRPEPGVIR